MERRAVQRIRAKVLVQCRIGDRTELVETYDISTEGCMLQGSNRFCDRGDEIEMAIGDNRLKGWVVWAKHRNAGVQFSGPASADTFAAILSADEQTESLVHRGMAQPTARRLQWAVNGVLALSSLLLLLLQ